VGELTSRRLVAEVSAGSERLVRANAELRHQASHDPLTGLATREVFLAATRRALADSGRRQTRVAVLLIDIDRFKTVNDAMGHSAGDQVLVQVATRLQSSQRGGDLAARHGGGSFSVLLTDLADEEAAGRTAHRLRLALAEPWTIDDQLVNGTVSIGLAVNVDPTDSADDLLRHADAALYQVKDNGRNGVEVFDQTLRHSLRHRISDEIELRDALAAGQIAAWFQPVVDMRDGSIVGAEALARWIHPEHGILLPGRFLTLLEDAGLLPALSRDIAGQAFAFRRAIEPLVPASFRIAVNVGVRDQSVPMIIERLIKQAQEAAIAPTGITLEITETAVIGDPTSAATAISQARQHGFAIALDDFGTGFSSLALVRDLQLDILKIDRSFVHRMSESAADAAIVAGVLDLAARMNLSVVTEGVEQRSEVDRLLAQGAVHAQGFYYSPAVPPEAFTRMLQGHTPWDSGQPITPGAAPARRTEAGRQSSHPGPSTGSA
jgi:diguanylate cyclase (GGDEF)-like protein